MTVFDRIKKLCDSNDKAMQEVTKKKRELTIEEALNSVMSYNGEPLTDND